MSHMERLEVQPVLWSGKSPRSLQPLIKRRCGEGCEHAENRQARRPVANLLKRSLCYARCVVIHAKDEGRDGINASLREPVEHCGVFAGLVKSLVHVGEVGWVYRLHANEYPFAA